MHRDNFKENIPSKNFKRVCVKQFIYICAIILVTSINFAQNKNSIYHNKEGWNYLKKGDDFRAILSFKESLKLNQNYIKAMIGLGNAYLKTEAFYESLKLFNNALKIEKDDIEAINGIGFAITGIGKYEDALNYFDRVLKISEENLSAKYGIAYIYYLMEKTIWAERKLKNILKINPYHYQSLLLMADIKISSDKPGEAKKYIQKAIDSKNDIPDGYIKFGNVYLKDYKKTDDIKYLNESINVLKKALAIHPENLIANRNLGYINLFNGHYTEAINYYKKAISSYPDNVMTLYNLAIAYEKNHELDKALNCYTRALKQSPSDSLLQAKLEDFLIINNYAIGHPLRTKFSNEHYDTAIDKQNKNLSSEAIMNLQRSILLNPVKRESREKLRDNFLTHNFYRYYVRELKTLLNIFPENKYQDSLNVAVIKRRDKLYHKAGYSREIPPRDVPNVLVLNFWPFDEITFHSDSGEVFANYLTFCLSQYGRMMPIGIKSRLMITKKIKQGRKYFGDNLKRIAEIVRDKESVKIDYIVFGTIRENLNRISLNCELLDFHTGVIISNFLLSENSVDNIPKLSLRVSKRIYESIPFKGRVLKTDRENIIVNMGLFDGIRPGDLIEISKLKSPDENKRININHKLIFIINESDTLISSARPLKKSDARLVNINDLIYPLKKRRSKLIK